jgi:hypothetical protein
MESYYPESSVKGRTVKFRELLKIPFVMPFILDIDYMEGFRCFHMNKEYSDPKKRMVAESGWLQNGCYH